MPGSFGRRVLYRVVRRLCWTYLKLHNRFRVVGKENLPSNYPVIVAANHTSNLDPVVVALAFPRRLRPLAKEELFQIHPAFTWLLDKLGALPLSRQTDAASSKALRHFMGLLDEGEELMIFPEGARSLDGRLMEIEGGAALVSVSRGVPIVPLYVAGTFEAMPVGAEAIGRHPITVYVGHMIWPGGKGREERERVRLALQKELERLQELAIG